MATAPHDGFAQLIHAEWTKLRTVRGWLVGLLVAVVLTIGIGLLAPLGSQISCAHAGGVGGGGGGKCTAQSPPKGPDGREVIDDKTMVYRFLSGDGSITTRLADFDGEYAPNGDPRAGTAHGLQPWSKAGILIKDGIKPGSAYAAVLATGSHGVRMQYDYVHDLPGLPGPVSAATPRWLRLVRSGDTVTGYNSADGALWTAIGTVRLPNLPHDVVVGVFAASPQYEVIKSSFGGTQSSGGPTTATGTFDRIALTGQTSGDWTVPLTGSGPDGQPRQPQGGDVPKQPGGAVPHGADGFVITGSGDIAPIAVAGGSGKTMESALAGTFAGLIAVIVVAALTMTAEYRRGLIRTSLAASPRRGRLLAAKATVLGGASFATGLVAAAIAVPAVTALEHHKGLYVYHASTEAQIRMVVGTAALLAVAAVLALAVGTIVRRGAAAVAAVIVVIVLPYILAIASVLPAGAAQWLTRLTPAAAFAVQQTVTVWPQVTAVYTPTNGYYPLSPWGGLAVLCLYAAVAYALAHRLLVRRDA